MIYQANNTKHKTQNIKHGQAGVTLLLSLLVLAAILAIAFSLASVALVEIRSSGDLVRTEPAYYAADAISEEALFKVKRNLSDAQFSYDNSLNKVNLTPSTESFVSTAIFQTKVPKTSYAFYNTRSRFPVFNTSCPSPSSANGLPSTCASGGSGYGRIKITYLDTGNDDHLKVYICQFDPRKGVDPTGSDPNSYRTIPCSDPNDTLSGYWLVANDDLSNVSTNNFRDSGPGGNWPAIDPYKQQEIILFHSGTSADIYAQIETFDQSLDAKGLPLVGSKALEINASYAGVVRKIRTVIPTNSGGGAAGGYTFVQAASNTRSGSSLVQGIGGIYGGSPVRAGNLLILTLHIFDNTTSINSVTDDHGNVWNLIGNGAAGLGERVNMYYAYNVAAGNTTVTAVLSGSASGKMSLAEFRGSGTSNPIDVVGANNGTNATPRVDLSGCQANDLLVGGLSSMTLPNPGSGFTQIYSTASWYYQNSEYNLDSGSAGNQTIDWSSGGGAWNAVGACFKVN